MAAKKTAPYGFKKDGTPKQRPGPKGGRKAKAVKDPTHGPRTGRTKRVGHKAGVLKPPTAGPDMPRDINPFVDVDLKFMSAVAGLAAGARWMVEDARPEFYDVAKEGKRWESSISAILPDGLDLRHAIRWVADHLHPGDVRTYVLRAGDASLEFALNEKGERIPRPAVIFKSVPRKATPKGPQAIIDAMKQVWDVRSAIGTIADWGMAMANPEIVDAAADARQAIDALTKTYSESTEEIEKAMGELAPNLRKHTLSVVAGLNDKEKDILRKRGALKDGVVPSDAGGSDGGPIAGATPDDMRANAVRNGHAPEARPVPEGTPTANECLPED